METTENNNQERCTIIKGFENLNSEGCKFFVDANSKRLTLMTSTQLRWLTHRENNGDCFTDAQRQAIEKIDRIANDRNHNAPTLRMRILLYADPRRLNDEQSRYIKQLIRCGGTDVRFLETREDQRLRISIQGKKLYLSMSERQDQEVHEGLLYVSDQENSPLIQYFTGLFENSFENAKRLRVNNNGNIVFADNFVQRFIKWINIDRWIAIICLLLAIIAFVF